MHCIYFALHDRNVGIGSGIQGLYEGSRPSLRQLATLPDSRDEGGARQTTEGVMRIGLALSLARKEHGEDDKAFGQWCKEKLPWLNQRMAHRFRTVAEYWSTQTHVSGDTSLSHVSVRALTAVAQLKDEPELQAGLTQFISEGESFASSDIQRLKLKVGELSSELAQRRLDDELSEET